MRDLLFWARQIQKARDTTRISSVSAIQSGIEQFYQDVSEYPVGRNGWLDGGQLGSSTTVNDYVPNLAEDPKHDQTCNGARCGYVYAAGADANGITNGAYEISTAFENQGNIDNKAGNDDGNDADRLEAGLTLSTLTTDQAQATAFDGGVLGATAVPLVIVNWDVVVK